MICADFLAGANLDNGNPEILLSSITRFFKFLPGKQRQQFLSCLDPGSFMIQMPAKRQRLRLEPHSYKELCQQGPAAGQLEGKSVAQETSCRSTTSNREVSRGRMMSPT